MRREIDPPTLGPRFYSFLNSVVVPRPIAWISTTSAAGVDNLAPHSFFTVSCVTPPIVQFTSVGRKDTLTNIEATGEFVINLAPGPMFDRINATATDFPPGVSEFDEVGIRREPSTTVRPPRVADSPAVLECTLHSTIELGDSTVVLGLVRHAAVDEDVLDGDHPDFTRMQPLARLGSNEWGVDPQIRRIDRIRVQDWERG